MQSRELNFGSSIQVQTLFMAARKFTSHLLMIYTTFWFLYPSTDPVYGSKKIHFLFTNDIHHIILSCMELYIYDTWTSLKQNHEE